MSWKKLQLLLNKGSEQETLQSLGTQGALRTCERARVCSLKNWEAKRKRDRMEYSNLGDTWLTSSKPPTKPS